jgi:quinolinate synthase
MIDNEMIQDATKMIKSGIQRLKELRDKVVLAHSYTSEIWIYYGLLVFLLFTRWAE